jgi:hypothetical protein
MSMREFCKRATQPPLRAAIPFGQRVDHRDRADKRSLEGTKTMRRALLAVCAALLPICTAAAALADSAFTHRGTIFIRPEGAENGPGPNGEVVCMVLGMPWQTQSENGFNLMVQWDGHPKIKPVPGWCYQGFSPASVHHVMVSPSWLTNHLINSGPLAGILDVDCELNEDRMGFVCDWPPYGETKGGYQYPPNPLIAATTPVPPVTLPTPPELHGMDTKCSGFLKAVNSHTAMPYANYVSRQLTGVDPANRDKVAVDVLDRCYKTPELAFLDVFIEVSTADLMPGLVEQLREGTPR